MRSPLLFCSLALPLLATAAPLQKSAAITPALATTPAQTLPVAGSGVWYEIFVRAWYDTDGNGIGDLNGVTAKLDYLKSLGVDGIWLMPINPSPSYHGYDVTDYEAINPQYGSMADFQRLLDEAHKRGIRVIMDLVINHTSDRHPWFVAAQNAHDPHRDWYQWATPTTRLRDESATGSPAWHKDRAGDAYLGIFVDQMPDLNYDNRAVRAAMVEVGRFWLTKGVDGFRLDAAQHVYFDFKRQQDDPAVLAKNLEWWSAFRHGIHMDRRHAYLVGEVARTTPEQLAPWLRPLDAIFDFPLAEQLILSAKSERNGHLGALLDRIDAAYRGVTHRAGVDAPFLSNHDQERVMSRVGGRPEHMRMAAALLLTLPGQPFVYYGEELGMRGRKPDPDLREPMRWYRAERGEGQTRWKAFSAGDGTDVSVEAQAAQSTSLLARYKQLIGWRRAVGALRDGRLASVALPSPALVGWTLEDARERVLVVHNLGGKARTVPTATLQNFAQVRLRSDERVTLDATGLHLPPYSSAVLDPSR